MLYNDRWSRLILDTMGRGRLCMACSYRWCRLILDTMGRGVHCMTYSDRWFRLILNTMSRGGNHETKSTITLLGGLFAACNDPSLQPILHTMGIGGLCVACSYRWFRLILIRWSRRALRDI